MIDKEDTFSFAADDASAAAASDALPHAAHMALADEHEPIGAHAATPEADGTPSPAPIDDAAAAIHAAAVDILDSDKSETASAPAHLFTGESEDAPTPSTPAHAAVADRPEDEAAGASEPQIAAPAHMAEQTAPAAPAETPAQDADAVSGPDPAPASDTSAPAPGPAPEPDDAAVPGSASAHTSDSTPHDPISPGDTAEIDPEAVQTKLKDPGSTQSFEPLTQERIDTDSTYDAGTTTQLMWGARSDVGCVRSHNEDSYLVQSPLFCVCDGMGGHAAGEVASSIAVETIAKTAPNAADPALLAAAVEAANAAVIEAAENGLGKPGMGCTATCAYIEGNTIAIAHVGDSRAYLLHEGTLIRVTRDHSYVEELVDAGEITADEARVHPNRSVITRALGSDPAMYADHFQLNIEKGDRLILCSDGLSSMVPDSEIESIAAQSATAQICTDNLVDAALAAGGGDNVTVLVVDVVDDGRVRDLIHRRKRNLIIAVAALLIAVTIACIATFLSIRGSVFLGDYKGTVAIYTGINGDFLGIPLYQLEDTTSVELSDLPDDTQSRLSEGIAQDSIEAARDTISQYRRQIDADETKQVETAEAIRKSADADAGSAQDSEPASDDSTQTTKDQTTEGGA